MANLITLLRLPLLILYALILYSSNAVLLGFGFLLLLVIYLLDAVDGKVARSRGSVTLLGSVLDVALDRVVETVLWVVFAHQRLLPIAVPLALIIRGVIVDAFRAVGAGAGVAPLDLTRSSVERFIVASRFMRIGYSVVKVAAFALLNYEIWRDAMALAPARPVHLASLALAWTAVVISLARGLPVLAAGFAAASAEGSERRRSGSAPDGC